MSEEHANIKESYKSWPDPNPAAKRKENTMADKKILVLCASARKNGNSEMLADAFIEGAKAAGGTITKLNLYDMNIKGCNACNGCWNSGGNCVVKDDMQQLHPLLEEADVLVLASPLYWSSFPAQMKAPIDRIYQYDPHNGGKQLKIGQAVLLTTGETESEGDFDMIKQLFTIFAEFNGMEVAGIIAVPSVNYAGDIKGNAALEQAKALGASL